MTYLWVSKQLSVPEHARRLINASAFPSVFKLYVVLVWDFCFICRCFPVLIYQTNMAVEKILAQFHSTSLATALLTSICRCGVVGARAPFFSLDETKEQHI